MAKHASSSCPSSVSGACHRCGAVFGEFYNAFTQVTGSYYLPSLIGAFSSTNGGLAKGRTKSAAARSELDGCKIQALSCSACNETLGITVTLAPQESEYCDRQLFKLPKIILASTKTGLPAEPYIDEVRHNPQPRSSNAFTMESDVIAQPLPTHSEQPPTTKTPQTLPSRPVKIASKESTPAIAPKPAPAERMGPITSASPPNGHAIPNGHHAPPPPTAGEQALSAVRQLSEQVQWCVASCMEQNKHLERLDHNIHRIYQEINGLHITVEKNRREAQANPPNGRRPEDPMELEILQDAVSKMQNRVNELDGIKMQMDLFKSRLRRVEETAGAPNSASSVQGPPSSSSASQHESAPHHTPAPLALTTPHHSERLPPPPSHFQPIEPRVEPRLESRIEPRRELPRPEPRPEPHAQPTYQSAYPPVPSQAPPMEERSSSGGWASINGSTGVKRVLPPESGIAETPVDGSPKRQRVTSSDFRPTYSEGSGPYPSRIETSQEPRRLSDPHSSSDPSHALTFVPYSSQDADPDDSWRPESQREQLDGRRRGRGGGRGRGRKTLPQSNEAGTPEWERPEWGGSQVSPDGFYQPITPDLVEARSGRSNLVRRSSAGPPPSQTPSRMNTMDPYAHTKKSRTKPIRNADGILIRKDGRPDMRSQSSAANLRKVHARKEQQERSSAERRHTPTSGLATAPVIGTDGSADEDEGSASSGPTPTDERHAAIMGKIFPHGYEHKDRMDVAGQYFRKSSDSPAERKIMPQMLDSERQAAEIHPADFRPVNVSSAEKARPHLEQSEDEGMKRSFTPSTTESEVSKADRMLDGDGDSHMREGVPETQSQKEDRIALRKNGSPVAETQMDTTESAALTRDSR